MLAQTDKQEWCRYPGWQVPPICDTKISYKYQADIPPDPPTCNGERSFHSSVNTITGRVSHQQELFSLRGGALAAGVTLHYDSKYPLPGAFGPYWSHSYDISLNENSDGTMVLFGGGLRKGFYSRTGTTYAPDAIDASTLVKNADATFLVTRLDGTQYAFDAARRISRISDRYGNAITISAVTGTTTTPNVTTITDSAGRAVVINSDITNGLVTTIKDPAGNIYDFTYNAGGRLWKVTSPAPSTSETTRPYWEYLYNAAGLLEYKIDPNRNIVRYVYDAQGKVIESVNPNGVLDTAGNVVKEGNTKSLVYNPATGTTSFTDSDGGQWTYVYDPQTRTVKEKTDPAGRKTSYYYYADFTLKARTEPFEGGKRLTTFFTYDSHGNLLTQTDPVDISIYVPTLDPAKVDVPSLSRYNPPIRTAIAYSYDYANSDQIASMTDYRGATPATTTYQYSVENGYRVTRAIDPAGNVTTTRYNADGTIKDLTDANGKVTVYSYYPDTPANRSAGIIGLPEAVTGPDAVVTRTVQYDLKGNPLEIKTVGTDSRELRTVQSYDTLNRLRSVTRYAQGLPDNVTSYGYDNNGNRISQIDPEGKETKYVYDYKGHVTKVTDAQQHDTQYSYGGSGASCSSCSGGGEKLTAVIDAKQQSTSFLYDTQGRLILETDPLGKKVKYTYYDNGKVKEKIDATDTAERLLITYFYDINGNLTKKRYVDSSEETFTYYPDNRLWTATNAAIGYTFDYYSNGWLKSVTDNSGRTISYDLYDGLGQRKQVTYFPSTADQRQLVYGYDSANRLQTFTGPAGTFTYGYDSFGRRSSLLFPNQITASYGYDELHRLTNLSHQYQTTTIATYNYTHDQAGNRLTKSGSVSESYLYDPVYRLTRAVTARGTENYTYDAVGNRLTGPGPKDTAYQYDAANRQTRGKLFGHDYDNLGNQTSRTIASAPDKGWSMSWDYENRLTKMEKVKGAEKQTVTFKYDPLGRRVEKKHTAVIDGASKTTIWTYVYDQDNIALEIMTDGSGTTKTFYTHGQNVDEHLALERNGSFYNYHADALGSVTAITDSNMNPVQSYSYDSFGAMKPATGFMNGYTYTGREWDKETGLYYYRARYYDPMDGRFVSKDPIGFEGGINLYAYVQSNSINSSDPSGLDGTMTWPSGVELPRVCLSSAVRALIGISSIAAGASAGSVPACDDNGEPRGCSDNGKGKWMCEGNAKYDITGTPKHVVMGPWIVAYGKTAADASHAWIKACQASAPRGTTARHIEPRCKKIR